MTTTPATIEPPMIKAFASGLPADSPVVKPRNNKYADKTNAISESAFIIFIAQNFNAKNFITFSPLLVSGEIPHL